MKIAVAALVLSFATVPAFAADEGSAAITAIGEVNGIALACQQPAIASRTRNAVATTAPKTRANGEFFENATNTAYLEQGKGRPCPDLATLVKRLDTAEKNLSLAFPTK